MVHSKTRQETDTQINSVWIWIFVVAGISSFFMTFWLARGGVLPVMPFEDGGFLIYFMLAMLFMVCIFCGLEYLYSKFRRLIGKYK